MRKLAVMLAMAGAAVAALAADLYPLPNSVLDALSFQDTELPSGYSPVSPTNFMAIMGMKRNPDFIGNLREMETIARRGGCSPFVATYGRDGHILLMLNGVFFRHETHAREFLRTQQKQQRCVAAYLRPLDEGTWVLLYARDPDIAYGEAERRSLEEAIDRHARRIDAEKVFSTLWASKAL